MVCSGCLRTIDSLGRGRRSGELVHLPHAQQAHPRRNQGDQGHPDSLQDSPADRTRAHSITSPRNPGSWVHRILVPAPALSVHSAIVGRVMCPYGRQSWCQSYRHLRPKRQQKCPARVDVKEPNLTGSTHQMRSLMFTCFKPISADAVSTVRCWAVEGRGSWKSTSGSARGMSAKRAWLHASGKDCQKHRKAAQHEQSAGDAVRHQGTAISNDLFRIVQLVGRHGFAFAQLSSQPFWRCRFLRFSQ